jgi:leader peptidase (prepilin peptidase) / N-methyltransferase
VSLTFLLGLWFLAVGLLVGSYLNVVIYRLPRGLSTVLPRSRCPSCDAAIAPYDNVPLLSYLVLRGRCRRCQARISPRYPLIEALTGLLFLGCFLRFGVRPETVAAAAFCAAMVALAAIDLEHFILPDRITLPGIVLGLALSPWLPWSGWKAALLGAVLGAGLLLALWKGWLLLRGEEGMGLGDVKMLGMIGAFLGWKGALITLFLASLSGSLVGLALVGKGDAGLKTKLPFGTFLALGALVALFAGPAIARSYLSFF